MIKLTPCPFCEKLPTIRRGLENTYYVTCDSCREETPDCATEEDAIIEWNNHINYIEGVLDGVLEGLNDAM